MLSTHKILSALNSNTLSLEESTMADEAAFRTYLRDVIGVPDPREFQMAIQDQGLVFIEDFLEFDKEAIETLCTSIRKPGGTIANPDVGSPNAPAEIPNPGFSVLAICEKRLISAACIANVYDMVERDITSDTLSHACIKKYEAHHTLMDNHEDPERLQAVSRTLWYC